MALRERQDDTIAAIATPEGAGGIGIVRLSGPAAIPIAERVFRSGKGVSLKKQKSHTVQHGRVFQHKDTPRERLLDEVLLLVLRAPKSYTREDVVEINAHGGPAVLRAILNCVLEAGARLAGRGEFTKRAFLNGRLDLLQAEAVLDLVKSKTELSSRWAAANLEGGLSRKIRSLKQTLLEILSSLEASIDFPEEAPEADSLGQIARRVKDVGGTVEALLTTTAQGLIAKQGLRVVIAGRPNVGKSSLMNKLSKANRVIVAPHPGTTRDVVEEEIALRGIPVRLWDTAGLRSAADPVEQEGVERAKSAVADCDLVLYVLEGHRELPEEDRELLSGLQGKKSILVINKTDLPKVLDPRTLTRFYPEEHMVAVSCLKEEGFRELEDKIYKLATDSTNGFEGEAVVTTLRQREALRKVSGHLEAAHRLCLEKTSPDLIAPEFREALDALGGLVGEVVTDDMLDVLFDRFCIGK